MTVWQSLVLGLVQGLTEFLPVSSSAHLVFARHLMGMTPPPLAFDVLLHLGTLLAVVWYFRSDLARLGKDVWHGTGTGRRVLLLLVIGTIPAGLLGILAHDTLERLFASPAATAWQLAVSGVLLFATDSFRGRARNFASLTAAESAFIGLGQALAIVPGISRSGATLSFGVWRGLSQTEAARFSFLLSIPAILGAGLVEARSITASSAGAGGWAMLIGFAAALVSGAVSIAFFLRYLRAGRLRPFAVYCWLAAAAFLIFLAAR